MGRLQLDAPAAGDLPSAAREHVLGEALAQILALHATLEAIAAERADTLLDDHRRVRQAADARGRYEVRSLTPVDVIAAYVLLPSM